LHDAGYLNDLKVPPGNRLERPKGNWKIGWTKTRMNELIKGKRGVTATAAVDLAEALGTSPKLWMNLQATYDLNKAARARQVATFIFKLGDGPK
jgi:plasmid maintenance system antidote protein VapI